MTSIEQPDKPDQFCIGDISNGLCVDQTPETAAIIVAGIVVIVILVFAILWVR